MYLAQLNPNLYIATSVEGRTQLTALYFLRYLYNLFKKYAINGRALSALRNSISPLRRSGAANTLYTLMSGRDDERSLEGDIVKYDE